MKAEQARCDDPRVVLFLERRLSTAEEEAFEQHLDRCDACRERLYDETAEANVWHDATEFLSNDPFELSPLSSDAANEQIDVAARQVVDSLSPTDDPHMLGRIRNYEIAGVIGAGGMGVVLKGFDGALNRFVAIKVLAPHLATSGAARQRFAREAQAAAAVVHDNVIEIHGVDEMDGLPYLVMPYIRGESLQRRLDDHGPLSLVEILRIAKQAAEGLAAAHEQGIFHRDVKPANILLSDGVERVKLTDFGLARAADDASLTRTGVIAGTPQFMSPEQARGDAIDPRSDLFALGSVMYTMCTGHPPFRADSSFGVLRRITDSTPRPIRELNPDIPTWLCDVIEKLHAKSPEDRYNSAADVAELVGQCLAHVQQPMSEPLPASLDRRKHTGQKMLPWLAGLALLIVAAFVIFNQPEIEFDHALKPTNQPVPQHKGASVNEISPHVLEWDDGSKQQLDEMKTDIDELDLRSRQLFDDTSLFEKTD